MRRRQRVKCGTSSAATFWSRCAVGGISTTEPFRTAEEEVLWSAIL